MRALVLDAGPFLLPQCPCSNARSMVSLHTDTLIDCAPAFCSMLVVPAAGTKHARAHRQVQCVATAATGRADREGEKRASDFSRVAMARRLPVVAPLAQLQSCSQSVVSSLTFAAQARAKPAREELAACSSSSPCTLALPPTPAQAIGYVRCFVRLARCTALPSSCRDNVDQVRCLSVASTAQPLKRKPQSARRS